MSARVNKAPEAILEINGEDFKFYLHQAAYVEYINELQGDDKVSPAYNLVSACVKPDQKEKLCEIMQENAAVTIGAGIKLINAFGATAKVSIKK